MLENNAFIKIHPTRTPVLCVNEHRAWDAQSSQPLYSIDLKPLTSFIQIRAIDFILDHGITLAAQLLKPGPVQHGDVPVAVFDHPEFLQLTGGLADAFAAHAQHVGDQFLGHGQCVARQAVQRQQQPAAQLLVNRMMAVTGRRLSNACEQ